MTESSVWLPKGEQGDPGPQGPQGPIGPPGPPGPDTIQFALDLANKVDYSKGVSLVGGAARVVNSVADARTLPKTGSLDVFITSYYGDGKLGGGHYKFDLADTTSVDNGGTILVTTDGGRLKATDAAVTFGQFGAKADWNGTTGTDNTARIRACIDYMTSLGQGFAVMSGAILGSYVSIAKYLRPEAGAFMVSDDLLIPSYFSMEGNNTVIHQNTAGKDILVGTNAYKLWVSGVKFSGGRYQINIGNANLDRTVYTITNCEFILSSSFAIRTFPTGGATSHLSAICVIDGCTFAKPRQALLNYCDSCTISNSWVFVDKDNFSPSSAVFVNGSLTTDGYPNLYMWNMFGVPNMGVYDANPVINTRLTNIRWVDLYKGAVHAKFSRFGGESAGMCPVYNFALPNTIYPYIGPVINITDSEVFCGPNELGDSAVVSLQGQLPARITIERNKGPLNVPYVANTGGQISNIATYLANWEATTSQKAWRYFKIMISGNDSLAPDGTVFNARVPIALRPYCNNFRETKVRKTVSQAISSGFVNNLISFDTIDVETQGCFDIANNNRFTIPQGATRMRLNITFNLAGNFTVGTLAVRVVNSALAAVATQSLAVNTNADNTSMTIVAQCEGTPGTSYFHVSVLTNTAASVSVIAATAWIDAIDYIN